MLEKGAKIEGDLIEFKTDFSISDLHQPIWIPGHVPSSKNSRTSGRHNSTTAAYIQECKKYYTDNAALFRMKIEYLGLTPPYDVYFRFIRNSANRRWDYTNIAQIVLDLMQEENWIEDDEWRVIKPHFFDTVVDKENPGVLIFI